MQDNYELEKLRRKARSFVLELRYEATWANFMAKFNAFETAVLGLKYRPDQPRAPKGTPEGGQWIVDVGSARQRRRAEEARIQQQVAPVPAMELSPEGLVVPQSIRPAGEDAPRVILVAQLDRPDSFYETELEKEELTNKRSHAFSRHIDITDVELIDHLNLNHKFQFDGDKLHVDYVPVAGRFLSLERANSLVSQILKLYPNEVEKAVSGDYRVTITHYFSQPTGVEAFRAHEYAIPVLRPTFGVRVMLSHEPKNDRRYVIITAFPMNEFPDEVFGRSK